MVPRTEFQAPGRSAPDAIWAAQPSVIPAMTGVPAGMPVASAAVRQTSPSLVPGRTTSGNCAAKEASWGGQASCSAS